VAFDEDDILIPSLRELEAVPDYCLRFKCLTFLRTESGERLNGDVKLLYTRLSNHTAKEDVHLLRRFYLGIAFDRAVTDGLLYNHAWKPLPRFQLCVFWMSISVFFSFQSERRTMFDVCGIGGTRQSRVQ